jgi:hypothetical protein
MNVGRTHDSFLPADYGTVVELLLPCIVICIIGDTVPAEEALLSGFEERSCPAVRGPRNKELRLTYRSLEQPPDNSQKENGALSLAITGTEFSQQPDEL